MTKLIRITTVPISLDKLLGEQLRHMNQFYEVTAISADENRLREVADKYGVDSFHVEMTREITPIKDLKALWKLFWFLKREQPEIVHSHTPKAGIVGMLAAKLAGVPIRLHTVAGLPLLEESGLKRKILNLVERLTYACATKVLPNSYGLKQIIIDLKFANPNKLEVIANGSSNGINTKHFSLERILEQDRQLLKKSLEIKEDDFVFIFVGRLVKDKGINELIEAFQKINRNDVKLLLVGNFEHDLDPLLPQTLESIENNLNIIPVGWQNDVRPYLAISDALVFPSYREGFPNVVMQAGAMSLPSIVSNINGCNEIIQHKKNGLIIASKDSQQLYQAMLEFLNNEKLFINLKEKARSNITHLYDQEIVWGALLKFYENLL
ncbi:glycosyltransferase family 4 protein [Weeksellaceae bacterium KMM 9713]|uniref:Glycosyltransferase family 4 protein n=1 Tax=Profundicola chukchiensis TaxID=2961959 RepID=A0A9X4RWS8_9FLAO|nr:glycosyltransferase family 4 protein [Profundicola chukchiensis]MDG4944804.1 glycosyltransferase family 4 protein [Profundicola chukchiensis]